MYDAAMEYGLLTSNPVWGVKPPKQRSDPAERITYADLLLKFVDPRIKLADLK